VRESPRLNTILCEVCKAARVRAHNARGANRRRGEVGSPRGPYSYDDIPSAEIERRFQAAKAVIRKRRFL